MNNNANPNYPLRNIQHPGENDILCGRGGGTNAHSGNIKFRKLVATHKLRYLAASKSDKPNVARDVVKEWRNMNPPGRFLAKMDMKQMILEGLITIEEMKEEQQQLLLQQQQQQDNTHNHNNDNYNNNNNNSDGMMKIPPKKKEKVYWYDVGDKKAREKASQCLRERNGAANEAVAALVKTVTANGEACPEDYATLMSKAALLKEGQQSQQQNPYNSYPSGGGNNYNTTTATMGGNGGGSGGGGVYCEPVISGTDDDVIEAEIQRLLRNRQEQMMSQINSGAGGGAGDYMNNIRGNNNNNLGGRGIGGGGGGIGGIGSSSNSNKNHFGGFGGDIQPYMGEESVMREYQALLQKQQELDARLANANAMMNQQGNHNMMASLYNNNMGGMMGGGSHHHSPYGNQQQQQQYHQHQQQQATYIQDSPQSMSPNLNPNAARDYMNRLRMLRQGNHGIDLPLQYNNNNGGMPESVQSSLGGGGGIMNNMGGGGNMNNMGGGGMSGGGVNSQKEFSIEEYQASLQEFLYHDDGNNNTDSGGGSSSRLQFKNASNVNNNRYGISTECIQVPTNLNDGNRRSARRNSDRSVDDIDLPIGRNTFKSVDSDSRPSFQSMDDVGIRDTFRSVDTMDLMSIGASLNEIVEEEIKNNPEERKKYSRRLSASSRHSRYAGAIAAGGATLNDFAHLPGATVEVKTMNHGQGGGGGPKKIRKAIDPRLVAMAGKSGSGGAKDSVLSTDLNLDGIDDGRMSFGNMSLMSGLTDFGDALGGDDDV